MLAMIEIGFGIVVLAAGLAAGIGLAGRFVPLTIGMGGAGAIALLGLILIAHGIFCLMLRRRTDDRHWLRTTGLMWVMLTLLAFFGFAVHALAPLLDAFKVAGFPLGYYMAAQGAPIAFVIMLFLFAARADTIDVEEGVAEDE